MRISSNRKPPVPNEIGTKWDVLDNKLSLTAAIFRNETNNARVRDPNTSLAEMVGRKSVTGLELGFAGSITPPVGCIWRLYLHGQRTKDIGTVAASDRYNGGRPAAGTGLAFPNTPKHSLSFWTSYKFTPQFTLGVGAVAQSDVAAAYVYSDNGSLITKGTPGYVRYDAMMNYAFTPNLSVQVNVYNLTNKVYYASTFFSALRYIGCWSFSHSHTTLRVLKTSEESAMLLHIPALLTPDDVTQCRQHLEAASWHDGRHTAGHLAAAVKSNLQLPTDSPIAHHGRSDTEPFGGRTLCIYPPPYPCAFYRLALTNTQGAVTMVRILITLFL